MMVFLRTGGRYCGRDRCPRPRPRARAPKIGPQKGPRRCLCQHRVTDRPGAPGAGQDGPIVRPRLRQRGGPEALQGGSRTRRRSLPPRAAERVRPPRVDVRTKLGVPLTTVDHGSAFHHACFSHCAVCPPRLASPRSPRLASTTWRRHQVRALTLASVNTAFSGGAGHAGTCDNSRRSALSGPPRFPPSPSGFARPAADNINHLARCAPRAAGVGSAGAVFIIIIQLTERRRRSPVSHCRLSGPRCAPECATHPPAPFSAVRKSALKETASATFIVWPALRLGRLRASLRSLALGTRARMPRLFSSFLLLSPILVPGGPAARVASVIDSDRPTLTLRGIPSVSGKQENERFSKQCVGFIPCFWCI